MLDEISDQRAPKSLPHGLDSGPCRVSRHPLTIRELEGLSVVQVTVDGWHHYPGAFATRETTLEVLEVVTPLRIAPVGPATAQVSSKKNAAIQIQVLA